MGLMKKLTSAIVASSLVFSLAGSAFAAYTPAAGETAGNRMLGLQILKGKYPNDALALKDEITRAELVTVIVRAFGQEANAALLNGAAAYPDTASHWASGNIAMAKALVEKVGGDAIGMPDGSFAPDAKLTPAQAVAFLMKFLGVKADATKAWPASYLDVAVAQNIITAEDAALLAPMSNDNATRGLVFYLFDRAFYNYDLGAGKTFYTKYVDPSAPVVTLNAVEPTTLDSKVTITGKVEGATEVFVGTTAVTVDANGNFSADYALPELKEYTIAVTAKDLAGNTAEEALTVTRAAGAAATVEAAAITVAAGETVDVAAAVKDAKGNTVSGLTIAGESALGTYADGKFTAGKTAGEGKLVLTAGDAKGEVAVKVTAAALAKVVADKASAAPGEIVTLSAQDEFGNAIAGAAFTQTSADAMLDGATGKFMASKAGNYTVTAKVGDVEKTATIGVFAGFSKTAKVVVEAPQTIVGNGESVVTVTAKVVDANGNVITTYNDGIELEAIANLTAEEKTDEDGVATYEISASNLLTGQVLALKAKATKDGDVKGETAIQVIQQVATSIEVAAPTYLAINKADGTIAGPATALVTVLDQNGEPMLHGAYAVTLDLTGTAATFAADNSEKNSTTVVYDGSVNAAGKAVSVYPRSLTSVGDVNITASLTGLTSGTDKITAAYAQAPSQVNLAVLTTEDLYTANVATKAEKVTFRAQLRDANGVPATSTSDKTVTFDLGIADFSKVKVYEIDALTGARLDSDANAGNGLTPLSANPTGTITAGTTSVSKSFESETFIGDLNVTAKVTNMTSGTAKATFVSGPAYSVSFARTSVKVAQGTESVDLSAQVYDEAGNKVLKAGKAIYFTANGTNAWVNGAEKATVETDANGVATVKVTTIGYYNVATFDGNGAWTAGGYKVSINPAADATDLVVKPSGSLDSYVSVDNSVASTVTVKTQKSGTDVFYVKTTDSIDILATVKDAKGQKVTNDTVKAVFPKGTVIVDVNGNLAAAGTANASEKTVTMAYNAGTGYYELTGVYFAKAPTATFTVKDTSGVADIVANSTLAVAPATASKIVVTSADSNDKVAYTKGQVSGPFTVQLTDAFGNPVYADATTGDIKIDWAYPAVDASAGQYFEIKASATGARLTGGTTATDSNLVIKQGSNSVTFYVFGNVDGTVTFNATGSVMGALTSTDATTFDQ